MESVPTVIGIDVGGRRKGFHAVALTGGAYADRLATSDVRPAAGAQVAGPGPASAS